MKRFKKILIVCDEVDNVRAVLGRGLWLAKANGASVTLLDVIQAQPGELARHYSPLSPRRAQEIEEQVERYYQHRLGEMAVRFREDGVEAHTTIGQGTAFLAIIRQVIAGGHDLVLKGAQSHGESRFFAGNDMHLMRKCPCPVWILQAEQPAESRRILAAVDPDTDEEQRMALNRTVMELATSLADRDDAELHVVHSWHLQEETTLRSGRFAMHDGEIAAILNAEEARHQRAMDAFVAAFPEARKNGRFAVLKGAPGEVIPDYVTRYGIDTVVMGTVGRTGVAGFFIGNTAETILSSVDCSVLTVKPPGFVSPVVMDTT